MRYRLDLINPEEQEDGAIVPRGRDVDVTGIVAQGKIVIVRP